VRAAENGRSVNTEIVDAIEKHLASADRFTQLWGLFEKHQQYIEAIPSILSAIREIEAWMPEAGEAVAPARFIQWKQLPPLTGDRVQTIKAHLKETNDEEVFLALMGEDRIEDIRGFEFERVMRHINEVERRGRDRAPITADQVQTIKAVLKEIETDEQSFLSAMGFPR